MDILLQPNEDVDRDDSDIVDMVTRSFVCKDVRNLVGEKSTVNADIGFTMKWDTNMFWSECFTREVTTCAPYRP